MPPAGPSPGCGGGIGEGRQQLRYTNCGSRGSLSLRCRIVHLSGAQTYKRQVERTGASKIVYRRGGKTAQRLATKTSVEICAPSSPRLACGRRPEALVRGIGSRRHGGAPGSGGGHAAVAGTHGLEPDSPGGDRAGLLARGDVFRAMREGKRPDDTHRSHIPPRSAECGTGTQLRAEFMPWPNMARLSHEELSAPWLRADLPAEGGGSG